MILELPSEAFFRGDPYTIDMDTATVEEIDAFYHDIGSGYAHCRDDAQGVTRYHFCVVPCRPDLALFLQTPCYCTYTESWHLPGACGMWSW